MRGVNRKTRTNQTRKARPTSETKVHPSTVRSSAPVVAELEGHAEVGFAEQPHHLLKLVARGRRDAELIALDAGLDLLELAVLEELDDLASLLGRDPLLKRDVLAHSGVAGRRDGAARQIAY